MFDPWATLDAIAEKEEIDIRSYSIIYDAINDVKDAMEGMLSPEMKEEVTGTAEIRETFKISKVGTIAGCMVTSGKIFRNSGIRIIREGVVVFTGNSFLLNASKTMSKKWLKDMIVDYKSKTTTTLKSEMFWNVSKKLQLKNHSDSFRFKRNAEGKVLFTVSKVFNPINFSLNRPA